MLEQWLRYRHIRVHFYPNSGLLNIFNPKAIHVKNIQINLLQIESDATYFEVQKAENDNFDLILNPIDSNYPSLTLMTFRDEEDAQATLACIQKALFGSKIWYQKFAESFRFALTVLGTIALFLVVLIIGKGYVASNTIEQANLRTAQQAQMAMQQMQAKKLLQEQQLIQAKKQLGQEIGQPPPPEQSQQTQTPQATPKAQTPGDAVAQGLEGN